ncbi:unnamed protein product [Adineta ricciae]|uniref:Uncharacterized protein n=1 Tax=Adineta ricciae TaxID=249248 RepID=A0A816D8G4_ADIRI|nr:unnamed protein product [Adineta ricciae]
MPFAVRDVLQHKRNERQIREIHEREYTKYIVNLRQQTFHSNLSHISPEHVQEIERSKVRNLLNKNVYYDRIQRENELLSKRLFNKNNPAMIDTRNHAYKQNLDIFNKKRFQQRVNEYQRIYNENQILNQRLHHVRGQLISKQQYDHEWQRHINVMKQMCDYPENIDAFVSNKRSKQRPYSCKWNQRLHNMQQSSYVSERPLSILLGLVD